MASEEGLRAGEPDRQLRRIQELERVFGHFYSRAIKGDLCTYCGLELLDRIHWIHHRTPSPKEPS